MKKFFYCSILIVILFSLTGCYDAKGLENFYYIVAIGIDEASNDLIKLSIQTAHSDQSSSSSSSQSSEYKIYSVECVSINTGINILNDYLNKTINLSHCSAIVFSESIAKKGIKQYISLLENNTEIRPSCNVIVSSKSAYDVLDNVANSGEHFSSRLYDYIFTSTEFTGYTVDSKFVNFVSKLDNHTSQALSVYATINGNAVQNSGAAVFKDDILVGTISPLQSIMHLLITNNLDSCSISIDNPFIDGNQVDVELRHLSKTKTNVDIVNNTPVISINLNLECIVNSSDQTFDYTDFNNVQTLKFALKKYLETEIKDYLYLITKDYNSDVVGFGEILPAKFLTKDEFEKIHWNEVFQDSVYNVNTEIVITSSNLFNKE